LFSFRRLHAKVSRERERERDRHDISNITVAQNEQQTAATRALSDGSEIWNQ